MQWARRVRLCLQSSVTGGAPLTSDVRGKMNVYALTLDAKTRGALIAAAALGVVIVIGQVVTFLGGLYNTTGWDVAKFPCECAWTVLAFPLGWLGFIAAAFAKL